MKSFEEVFPITAFWQQKTSTVGKTAEVFCIKLSSVVEDIFQSLNVDVAIELREISRELD